jgi:GT2 family glycosyltransferase
MARVAAIVVNWNGADRIAGCLEALAAQEPPLAEIVVVDNASTDGSLDVVAGVVTGVVPLRVLRNADNRGFAGGANDGIEATTAPVVLICNPDTRPRPDYVARAVAALLSGDRIGAVQGKLLRLGVKTQDGMPIVDTTGHVAYRTRIFANRGEGDADRGQWETAGAVFGVSGALGLYRRDMLDDIALPGFGRHGHEAFDEDLFAFFDDVDVDWRAAMRGWIARYEPSAVAEHERGGAGPRRTRDVERLNFANRLLLVVKCDTPRSVVGALPGMVVTTAMKAVWLLVTAPRTLVSAVSMVARGVRLMRAKRALVHDRATVASEQVVRTWFVRFGYAAWVRTWWRRMRRPG